MQFAATSYQVIISAAGHQVLRSAASNSKTVIEHDQQTGQVSIRRRA